MTDFEREYNMRPGYGYSDDALSNAPAWILGFIVVALLLGVFATSGGNTGKVPALDPGAVYQTVPAAPAPLPPAPVQKP